VREILPPPDEVMTQALARVCERDEPVVVEYALPMDGLPPFVASTSVGFKPPPTIALDDTREAPV
jgi:hypothetical protein